jgi:hypothetical protein
MRATASSTKAGQTGPPTIGRMVNAACTTNQALNT